MYVSGVLQPFAWFPLILLTAVLGQPQAYSQTTNAATAGQGAGASTSSPVAGSQGNTGPADPNGLIRYVPAEKLAGLVEFQGLDQHADAWKGSAASQILSETNTGAMLEEIYTQVMDQSANGVSDRRLTSQESLALTKEILRAGILFSISGENNDPSSFGAVLVHRNAFANENKSLYAKMIAGLALPGTQPSIVDKPGDRRVVVVAGAAAGQMAWWVEDRRDLVICYPHTFADKVIATLDGKNPNAASHPLRTQLAKADAGIDPIGWSFLDLKALPPMPPAVEPYGLRDARSVQLRWGIEGKALRTDLHLESPAPRAGLLALMEQPGFKLSDVPNLPESFEALAMASLVPARFLDDAKALAGRLGQPQFGEQFDDMAARFEKATKLNLRKDLLDHLGPHFTSYSRTSKKAGLSAALGAFNPLAGIQIPEMTLLYDVKDEKAVNKALTKVMAYVNKQLATVEVPGLPPGTGGQGQTAGDLARPGANQTSKGTAAKKTQPFSFRMTSPKPPTYQLTLPEPIGSILGLKPTLLLGPKHLIVATTPDLATEAFRLEEKGSESWSPSGEFSDAVANLPGKLAYLTVNDPRQTLPKTLAELPASLNTAFNQLNSGQVLPGLNGMIPGLPAFPPAGGLTPPAPAGTPNAAPGAPTAGGGQPSVKIQGAGAGTRAMVDPGDESGPQAAPRGGNTPPTNSVPAGYPGAGGRPPAGPGGSPGGPVPNRIQIKIDPAKIPAAESIRPFLFPGVAALSFDQTGIHWVSRQAFFDVGSIAALAGALGSARSVAMPGVLPPGVTPPSGPPGTPGTNPGAGAAPRSVPDNSDPQPLPKGPGSRNDRRAESP